LINSIHRAPASQ
jgi:hypothetical protein